MCTAPSKSCVQKIRLLRPTKTLSTCDSAQSLQMLRKYITQRDCLLTCPVLLLGPYSVANYVQSICKLCTESLIKRVFVDIKSQIFRTQLFLELVTLMPSNFLLNLRRTPPSRINVSCLAF